MAEKPVERTNHVQPLDAQRLPPNGRQGPERHQRGVTVSEVHQQSSVLPPLAVTSALEASGVPDRGIRRELLGHMHVTQRPIIVSGPPEVGEIRWRVGSMQLRACRGSDLRVEQAHLRALPFRPWQESG